MEQRDATRYTLSELLTHNIHEPNTVAVYATQLWAVCYTAIVTVCVRL